MLGALPILFSLIPLLILVGIIAIAVKARQTGDEEVEPGIGTLRRVFLYILSFAGLATAGAGMVLLLRAILDALFSRAIVAVGETTLALGLALTIVGAPVWLGFWWAIMRALRAHLVETRSLARKVYTCVVLGGSALTAAAGALSFLQWLLGAGDFSGTPLALLLVWGAVWAYHWRLEDIENQLTDVTAAIRRLYVYGLTLFSLATLAVGSGSALHLAFGAAYRSLFGSPELIVGEYFIWNDAMRSSVAAAIVGGVIWWWHWLRAARADMQSAFRSVYLYLFAILGGAATLVTSCTVALYHLLQWLFGRPETSSALEHFDVMPGLLAAIIAGGGVWGYHWSVTSQEASVTGSRLSAARRVYFYLVSAVGLITIGVGLVILLAVFFGLVGPSSGPSLRGDLWRNPFVLSLTLLFLGVPIWWIFWRSAQRLVTENRAVERSALSRRVFIHGTFGASVLLTLVNVSIVLFNVFDVMLGGRTATALLWDSRWSLAMVLTAGVISGYHWSVLQEDRRALAGVAEAPEPRSRKNVTVLAGEADSAVVRRLEAFLGQSVISWHRLDGATAPASITDEELLRLVERIATAASDHVLLLIDSDGMRAVPYLR